MVILTPKKFLLNPQFLRYKFIFIIIGFLCAYILLTQDIRSNNIDARKCFANRNLGIELDSYKLEDILLSNKKPKRGKSIFFHETSCSKNNIININSRQACAIESAALTNPNYDVFVLFASPTALYNETTTSVIEAIKSYPNVYLRNVNLWSYAADTPIYEWLKDGELFNSKYVLSHTSDFLRYLTLWRWGGTYLDLDVVMKKSLEKIPPNFAGAESERFVAAGVLNFDSDGFGHEIADMCLRNFQIHFDGRDWGNNGPGVITRVLKDICKTKAPPLMSRERCFGFKVYDKMAFYAVPWPNWKYFFDTRKLHETLNMTKESISIHVWNKHSKNTPIRVGSQVAYGLVAEQFCPKVYKASGIYF